MHGPNPGTGCAGADIHLHIDESLDMLQAEHLLLLLEAAPAPPLLLSAWHIACHLHVQATWRLPSLKSLEQSGDIQDPSNCRTSENGVKAHACQLKIMQASFQMALQLDSLLLLLLAAAPPLLLLSAQRPAR